MGINMIQGTATARFLLCIILALAALPARAAFYTVNKFSDSTGACTVSDCSLRAAISAANANAGQDVVNIPAGTYVLQIPGVLDDLNETGDLDITDSVIIRGLDAGAVIDGNFLDRVFDVFAVGATPVAVTFENLEIINGSNLDECGGGVNVYDDGSRIVSALLDRVILRNNAADTGGGLCNFNYVELRDSDIHDNTAVFFGGGVDNGFAELRMDRSAIYGNTAATDGGGIDNTGGILLAFNSTISGNTAGDGGAIWNGSGGEAFLGAVTMHGNAASNSVNGVQNDGGSLTLGHTILDNGPGLNCQGNPATSQNFNIESGSSCGLNGPNDLLNTNPMLSALALWGGLTPSHLPLDGSPAIDIDPNNVCLDFVQMDQLGSDRPQDGDGDGQAWCDSGSVEVFAPTFACSDFAALDDANNNGSTDFAVLCESGNMAGQVESMVLVRDGATGGVIAQKPEPDSAESIAVGVTVPLRIAHAGDVNGNGSSDVAVLGGDESGKIIVQVSDGRTGALIRNVQYYNPGGSSQFEPRGLVVIPSINGNASAEIGVVALNTSDQSQIVQFRDALTGAFVVNDFFLQAPWGFLAPAGPDDAPRNGWVVLPDLGGGAGPELGMLAVNQNTGQIVVMVKDVATNAFIRNVFFLNSNWNPVSLVALPNLDGNPGGEIGLVAQNKSTGQIVLMIKDAGSNTFVVNNFPLGSSWTPTWVGQLAGLNGSPNPATAVLGRNAGGKWAIQEKDAATNTFVNNVFPLSSAWNVRGVAVVNSLGGSAAPDFAVFGERKSDGLVVIHIVDAQTDEVIRNIFPN